MKLFSFITVIACISLVSCAPSRMLNRSAKTLANDPALSMAHLGISIYDPVAGKYLCNYQGDKYFIPASNTKLATCYAAMKYLGDSLTGLRYDYESDSVINVFPTGDPSFLHQDFSSQPVLHFLQHKGVRFYLQEGRWQTEPLGSGWSWNDYTARYMAERSALPVYGNLAHLYLDSSTLQDKSLMLHWHAQPASFAHLLDTVRTISNIGQLDVTPLADGLADFLVNRLIGSNEFVLENGGGKFTRTDIPFFTNNDSTAIEILRKDHGIAIFKARQGSAAGLKKPRYLIHSQPTDSLLRPMMHRSDNFFAEQSLLMVSDAVLGVLSDDRIIDTLLRSDLADLPQKPHWVDGSGLSRYNLFSPQDFVAILDRMRRDFGMDRIRNILPTGDEGTLSHYYKAEAGSLWAKTGSLSGVTSISGFVYTKKRQLLIFSVLVNNHQSSTTDVRRAVERFIEGIVNGHPLR
jgi:D-alanyl-D-alanine carboxypeptidase/D-alanyl-D-alanine-endopeptidase (penicillin-binding protein 4)